MRFGKSKKGKTGNWPLVKLRGIKTLHVNKPGFRTRHKLKTNN
jgi:hypothetical protein